MQPGKQQRLTLQEGVGRLLVIGRVSLDPNAISTPENSPQVVAGDPALLRVCLPGQQERSRSALRDAEMGTGVQGEGGRRKHEKVLALTRRQTVLPLTAEPGA